MRWWQRLSWPVLAAYLAATIAAGASMVYANRVARESERRWCGLITTLDDAYREHPPQSDAGRQVAADIAHLRIDLGC